MFTFIADGPIKVPLQQFICLASATVWSFPYCCSLWAILTSILVISKIFVKIDVNETS